MPNSEPKPDSPRRPANLEEWLQSPGTQDPLIEPGTSQPEEPPSSSAPEEATQPVLFPPEALAAPEGPGDEKRPGPAEQDGEKGQDDEAEDLQRLEAILAREFGDTLTGANALSGPIGLFLTVLALIAWTAPWLLAFLSMDEFLGNSGHAVLISAAVLSLAGLHLLFYWGVHRVSNIVKTRELDRLLEARRVRHPCRHLDCREAKPDERIPSDQPEGPVGESLEDSLRWRCTLFDIELEGTPLCAVCDRHEPREAVYPSSML